MNSNGSVSTYPGMDPDLEKFVPEVITWVDFSPVELIKIIIVIIMLEACLWRFRSLPSTFSSPDSRLLANCRPTAYQQSADSWPTVGEGELFFTITHIQ